MHTLCVCDWPCGLGGMLSSHQPTTGRSFYVYVCMCVCMHMFVHVCIAVCICVHACLSVCMHGCMHTHVHVCSCMHLCLCVLTCLCMCALVCMRACMCVHAHVHARSVCMYVCVFLGIGVCACMFVCACVCAHVWLKTCLPKQRTHSTSPPSPLLGPPPRLPATLSGHESPHPTVAPDPGLRAPGLHPGARRPEQGRAPRSGLCRASVVCI